MHFNCNQEVLATALGLVQRAVAFKSPLPALKGVLLSAEQGHLVLSATDLEFGMTCSIEANVDSQGSIVLPAKLMTEFIRRLPPGQVEIQSDTDNKLKIVVSSRDTRFNLTGFDHSEFPHLPQPGEDPIEFTIEEKLFKTMLMQTEVAIARDETRRVLTGLLMETESNKLKLVSTDGHRLAFRQAEAEIASNIKSIVPGKVVQELIKCLSDSEKDHVQVSVGKADIAFRMGTIVISSRLIEGKYPPYQQIIPTEFKTSVIVDVNLLAASLDRAEVVAREGASNLVKLTLSAEGMVINSDSPDVGMLEDRVEASVSGGDLEIRFNVRLLLDCLKNIGAKQASMDFTGPFSPCLVRPLEDHNCLHLVLPVRLH